MPLLRVARVDLSVAAERLMNGSFVGEVTLQSPLLQVVVLYDEPDRATPRSGPGWDERLDRLFPLSIDRFATIDGEVRYENLGSDPPLDFFITDFYLEGINFANTREESGRLLAELEVAGRPFDEGELEAVLALDPYAVEPAFELHALVRDMPLVEWNDFIQAYAGVDVEGGTLGLYVELAVADNQVEGYVKTLFENVSVLGGSESLLNAFWEAVVATAAEVLENQPYQRLATRVPIQGTVDDVTTDTGELVVALLRNAYIEALQPGLEGTVGIEDLEYEARDPAEVEESW